MCQVQYILQLLCENCILITAVKHLALKLWPTKFWGFRIHEETISTIHLLLNPCDQCQHYIKADTIYIQLFLQVVFELLFSFQNVAAGLIIVNKTWVEQYDNFVKPFPITLLFSHSTNMSITSRVLSSTHSITPKFTSSAILTYTMPTVNLVLAQFNPPLKSVIILKLISAVFILNFLD